MEESGDEGVRFRREVFVPGFGVEVFEHDKFAEAEEVKCHVRAVFPSFSADGGVDCCGIFGEPVGGFGHDEVGDGDSLFGKFCREGEGGYGVVAGPFEDVVVFDFLADEFDGDEEERGFVEFVRVFGFGPADKSECEVEDRVALFFKDSAGFVGECVQPLAETDVVVGCIEDEVLLFCGRFCKGRVFPEMFFFGRCVGFFAGRIKFHSLFADDQRVIHCGGEFPADLNTAGIGGFIVEEIVAQCEIEKTRT